MPTGCRICDHEKRDEIDAALTNNESYVLVAKRFQMPMASILNHRMHLSDAERSTKDEEIMKDVLLLAKMKALQEKSLVLILAGEAANDLGTLFSVVGQVRKNLELIGEFAERLHKVLVTSI